MIQTLLSLKNKKVKIFAVLHGTGFSQKYKGILTSVYHDGGATFVGLDTGEIINTFYIFDITVEE